jgi:hypothetical protein
MPVRFSLTFLASLPEVSEHHLGVANRNIVSAITSAHGLGVSITLLSQDAKLIDDDAENERPMKAG